MNRRVDGLRLLALYKFAKASLLLATVYGVYALLDPDMAARLIQWSATLTDRFERDLVMRSLTWFDGLGASAVHRVLFLSLGYAMLFVVEGVGLWMRRRWAEWLTVVSSAALIPFELWRIVAMPQHNALLMFSVLVGNIIIVVYLILRLRTERRAVSNPRQHCR